MSHCSWIDHCKKASKSIRKASYGQIDRFTDLKYRNCWLYAVLMVCLDWTA